jgi:hypothetical protein
VYLRSAIIAASCLAALPAYAQESTTASTPSTTEATTAPVKLPDEVVQRLDRMGTALRALSSFEIKSDVTTEDVLEDGQKLQSSSAITYDVRRPDRLYVEIQSPHKQRQFFYDGKNLTVYGPKTGYYATTSAPPTIVDMLKNVEDKFGLEIPMSDLFQWGTSSFPIERIKSGLYVGTDMIDGRTCDHLAFRQDLVDWQLWINVADSLPCKLAIANTEDEAQPQFTAVYRWTPNSSFTDAQFTFNPPPQAKRIALSQAGPAGTEGGK